jgi:hypothetical protein
LLLKTQIFSIHLQWRQLLLLLLKKKLDKETELASLEKEKEEDRTHISRNIKQGFYMPHKPFPDPFSPLPTANLDGSICQSLPF